MQVAQRGTSQTGVTSSGYASAPDRFSSLINGLGTWTLSQSSDAPDGFSSSYKWECTVADSSISASDYGILLQRMEGQNLQHLKKGSSNAESLTASFWVKSSKTGTYIFELYENHSQRSISKSYTISSANTWEYKSITFPGDTVGTINNDNTQSLIPAFWVAAGSNYSSGTLQTSWGAIVNANRAVGVVNLADTVGNTWQVTGVKLEVGSVATEFDHRSFGEELSLCQRYFFNPLFGRTTGSIYYPINFNQVSTGNNGLLRWQVTFPVSMRTSPSLTHSLTDAKFQLSAPNGTDNWAFYRQNSGWSAKAGNSDISVLNIAPSVNQANVGAYYVTPNDTLSTAIGIGGGATFNFSAEL
jgi:hypothetical protein